MILLVGMTKYPIKLTERREVFILVHGFRKLSSLGKVTVQQKNSNHGSRKQKKEVIPFIPFGPQAHTQDESCPLLILWNWQPGLQGKFHKVQDYIVRPSLNKTKSQVNLDLHKHTVA